MLRRVQGTLAETFNLFNIKLQLFAVEWDAEIKSCNSLTIFLCQLEVEKSLVKKHKAKISFLI